MSVRPWNAAEAARLRAFHDPQKRAKGESDRTDVRYNEHDGVASQIKTDTMRAARIGATPPVRAARHSRSRSNG